MPLARIESESDEQALIARCRAGDRTAFGELVARHQERVYNLCLRLAGDRSDAADMAQETFVRALQSVDRFNGRAQVFTWLYRIAVNLSIDRARKRSRGTTCSLDAPSLGRSDGRAGSRAERATSSERGPSDRADANEMRVAVQAALLELDDAHRVVVVMRDLDGLDYSQIAEILEIPVGTVKSRLFRARLTLRELLADCFGPDETR